MAAGLAMTAAALAASGARDAGRTGGAAQAEAQAEAEAVTARQRERRPVEMVSSPVRIADAATVRLLRRGDRVDVIAAAGSQAAGGEPPDARVVAAGVRVAEVPKSQETHEGSADGGGALVVLSVPRATAAALAGAGTTSRLAVTLR